MKHHHETVIAAALLAISVLAGLALTSVSAHAQYAMRRFTVDGGGEKSTGGTWAIRGTAGQPDAGTLTGITQALQGGFWLGGISPSSSVDQPVEQPGPPLAGRTRIGPASPNPCHGLTTLSFSLATSQIVRAEVYNLSGERIRTILNGPRAAGRYSVAWDGNDERGAPEPSGIYFFRVGIGNLGRLQKITVLR